MLHRAWFAAALVAAAAATGSAAPEVQLTATSALIMGGTFHPLLGEPEAFVDGYLAGSLGNYIAPTGSVRGDSGEYQTVGVYTPEQFWPFGGLSFDASVAAGVANLTACLSGTDSCSVVDGTGPGIGDPVVVFGYSQSARIATVVQRMLNGVDRQNLSFVLTANPNRPNGGILQRFAGLVIPILGVTFDGATPTGSFPTADISQQYDGWSDFPARPLNLLADLNALAGIAFLHSHYTMPVDDTMIQSVTGDTTYYLIPTPRLPILTALQYLGVPSPVLTALDAPLRVIIEWAYDRADPGTPATASVFGRVDPLTALGNLAAAIPTGLDDGLAEAGLGRPFGTVPAGPFGVGGSRTQRVDSADAQDLAGNGIGDGGGVGGRRHCQSGPCAGLVHHDPQAAVRPVERGVPDLGGDAVRRHRGDLGGGDHPAAKRRSAR